jgi:hypothetical protein
MAGDAAIVPAGLRPRILADRNGRISMRSWLGAQPRIASVAVVNHAELRRRFKASNPAWIAAPNAAAGLARARRCR